VLAHGEGENVTFGAPFVNGALVTAEVVEQGKNRTVIAFKKRRRQNSRRKIGLASCLTTVRIAEILLDGAKPAKKAAAKTEAKAEVAQRPSESRGRSEEGSQGSGCRSQGRGGAEDGSRAKASEATETAAPLFKAPKGEPDEPDRDQGHGPVAAKDLNEQGITTFAQLANCPTRMSPRRRAQCRSAPTRSRTARAGHGTGEEVKQAGAIVAGSDLKRNANAFIRPFRRPRGASE